MPASRASVPPTQQSKQVEAALAAVRESGLTGRPDSPPHWDKALANAQAGEPILVKDPEDSRDDFFLVPLNPQDPNATQGAWVMLDAHTLELREVSLLEDWQAPLLPTAEDTQKASQNSVVLPDGTTAKFSPEDLTPNPKNLVWQPSAAAVLPYWPVKEFTAPHPVSGEQISIYLTQDGKPQGHLGPEESEAPNSKQPPSNPPSKPNPLKKILVAIGIISAGIAAAVIMKAPKPESFYLLNNPGFETPGNILNGKTGEWTSQQGRINDSKNGVSPIGEWMLEFNPSDASSQAIATQVVAIKGELSKKRAHGEASIFASALYNVSSKAGGAKAFLYVSFLSAERDSRNLPTFSQSLILDSDATSWEKIELSAKLPKNAAFVVIKVAFDSESLDLNPGHVDEAKLTIKINP